MSRYELFCDVLPIIAKASPLIATLMEAPPILPIITALLGVLVNCDPHNDQELVKRLKEDPDLYAKIVQLEQTHAAWLKSKM